jgi:carboxyl-terminal processing protease
LIRRRVLLGSVLGSLFAVGWWAGVRAASGPYTGLDLFIEVLQTVQANYVDPVDSGKLVTGAMRGITHALDPWSRYLDPDEFRATRGAIQGTFDGIGATVDQRGGWPVVVAPIEGSPAWNAGLEPGDVITKVDGHSTFGMTPDEVGAKLRGGPWTVVTLTVSRDDGEREREVKLQREKVTVKNVPYSFLAAPGVGYVRLAHFSTRASADVAAACDTLRTQGARALLLDLRGNPGGTFDEAVAIASQFLPSGVTVVSTKGRANGTDQVFKSTRTRPELAWPLAVLVDGGSASASEIVAGALQDHDRAVLIGDTTFGKGVSQQIYPLRSSQGALQLTVSRYYTPSGRSIHRLAAVSAGEDDDEEEGDDIRPPAPDSQRTRTYRTDAGRIVRGGGGLAPDVRIAADTAATRIRVMSHHPGGLAGAARESLARDAVYLRALELVRKASDARGVFAAAGLKLPGTGGSARR